MGWSGCSGWSVWLEWSGLSGHSSALGIQIGGIMHPSALVFGGQGTMAPEGGGIGHQLAHVTPLFSSTIENIKVDTKGSEILTSGSTYTSMECTLVVGDTLQLQPLPP